MDIDDILTGLYGNDINAVLVFDVSGSLLWKNNAARELLECSETTVEVLASAIKDSSGDGGRLYFFGGGSYKRAELFGNELLIAELCPESEAAEPFASPLFEKYVHYSDSQVRQAVTGISASCEIINDETDSTGSRYISGCLENIIESCCMLLRHIALSSSLSSAVSGKNIRTELISLPAFMKSLAAGCASAMGSGSCSIHTDVPECYVKADKNLLMYFILMLVRRIMPHKSMRIEFSVNIIGESAEIKISSENSNNNHGSEFIDNIAGVFDEAYDIFAQKLGAEYTISEAGAVIKLKCEPYDGSIVLESDKVFLSDNLFSPCRIMLCDLTEFRNFY